MSMFRRATIFLSIFVASWIFVQPAHASSYSIPNPPHERLKDFSIVESNGTWHAYAMSVCADAGCSRPYSVIYHYISRDLQTWTNLGVVLSPRLGSTEADQDDVWAPSVIEANGMWYMYYTAVEYVGNAPIQRIAVATSTDLTSWNRTSNNVVFECSSVGWMYSNYSDPSGIGGDCRDPFVMRDDANGRWIMNVSTRTTNQWGTHQMIVGQLASTDLLHWSDVGSVAATLDWMTESSHIIRLGTTYYLFWTNNCPTGHTCLHWASASAITGPYSSAHDLSGVETYGFASEATTVGNASFIYYVGGGVLQRELVVTNGAVSAKQPSYHHVALQARIALPNTSSSIPLGAVSFFLYRDAGAAGFSAEEDVFVRSEVVDIAGNREFDLPFGTYWLVPDPENFLPGRPLAELHPQQYATSLTATWGGQDSITWNTSIAGRRWVLGGSGTSMNFGSIPATATTTSSVPFSDIHNVSLVGTSYDDARMMLSNDNGITWLTMVNGSWVVAPVSDSAAAPVPLINSVLDQFPIGDGLLQWQLFVPSSAIVVAVDISLNAAPQTPSILSPSSMSEVATLRPAISMMTTDADGSQIRYVLEVCATQCTIIDSYQTASTWTGLLDSYAQSGQLATWTPAQSLGNGVVTLRVRAVDIHGSGVWSDWSAPHSIITPSALTIDVDGMTVISTTSIRLNWSFSHAATVVISYTDEEDHEYTVGTPAANGSVVLTGLYPGATYQFFFYAQDIYGQIQSSSTDSIEMPTVATSFSPVIVTQENSQCVFRWTTSVAASGSLSYGPTADLGSTLTESAPRLNHEVRIDGCSGTVYFRISGYGGTMYESTVMSYTVQEPTILPVDDLNVQDPLPILRPIRGWRRG
jgi:hypothetical protein